jgi:hypothetical protein
MLGLGLANVEREQFLRPRRSLSSEDLLEQPVGFDDGDVVQEGSDAVPTPRRGPVHSAVW